MFSKHSETSNLKEKKYFFVCVCVCVCVCGVCVYVCVCGLEAGKTERENDHFSLFMIKPLI